MGRMGEDARQERPGHPSGRRVSVQEAARLLETTVDALRKRVQRNTIAHEKDEDGRVWILLDADMPRQDIGRASSGHRQDDSREQELLEELRDRLRFVERQLEAERQAHAEARRIIGGLVQRIPELEAPREAPGGHETAAGEADRSEPRPATGGAQEAAERRSSWWRRLLGG